jgi:hypothetical protein
MDDRLISGMRVAERTRLPGPAKRAIALSYVDGNNDPLVAQGIDVVVEGSRPRVPQYSLTSFAAELSALRKEGAITATKIISLLPSFYDAVAYVAKESAESRVDAVQAFLRKCGEEATDEAERTTWNTLAVTLRPVLFALDAVRHGLLRLNVRSCFRSCC